MSSDPFSDFQSSTNPAQPSAAGSSPQATTQPTPSPTVAQSARPDLAKRAPAKPTPSSPRKRSQRAEQPKMTVEQAIARGLPSKELDALVKAWTRFKLQEARDEAKAAAQKMAKAAEAGRRKIADELLRLADGYGCSMEEAKEIYKEALAAKFDIKVRGK